MLFSSLPFLYYFIPCVCILYFAVPKALKNSVLLLSSLFFYGWGEPRFLVFMLISIVQGYTFGRLIEKHIGTRRAKIFMAVSVVFGLSLLCYCKYADFFIANFNALTGLSVPMLRIALPIGISFYTFQLLSYVIDVYRGTASAQKNFIDLALYIAMFPQLIAGPIVRYSDIAHQLENRTHSAENAAYGIRRFVIGFSKKILVANVLGELVAAFKASDDKSVLFFWLYAVAYTLHVYFDFSGYSDMAIGLGRIFGFTICENFNYPYVSKSITEFWRRWHISLGTWFRDYVYIPLGGNRVSPGRHIFNIFVVWLATGFWHGAAWNFIIWGGMYAVLLICEKFIRLRPPAESDFLKHCYALFFIVLGCVVFDASSVSEIFFNIGSMFGAGAFPLTSVEALYCLRSFAVVIVIAAVGSTPLPKKLIEACRKYRTGRLLSDAAEPVFLLILLVLCTAYLVDGSFNPFLYFRF